jgi:hypothetical protein
MVVAAMMLDGPGEGEGEVDSDPPGPGLDYALAARAPRGARDH